MDHEQFNVPGEPRVKPDVGGYLPGDLRPSDVLPGHLWRPGGQQKTTAAREHKAALNAADAAYQLPSLPERQQAAMDAEDLLEYRCGLLDVAKNPDPGTVVWRSELRPDGEHPEHAGSVGMHWPVKPDAVVCHAGEHGMRSVIWQGRVENPQEQTFPRSHPVWSGKHRSLDAEAEIRFRPGARVRIDGAWVPARPERERGYFAPMKPERMTGGWQWRPIGRHLSVRYTGQGAADYSDAGIEKEAAVEEP